MIAAPPAITALEPVMDHAFERLVKIEGAWHAHPARAAGRAVQPRQAERELWQQDVVVHIEVAIIIIRIFIHPDLHPSRMA